MAEFTQVSESIIQQTPDYTKGATVTKGPDAPVLDLPNYTSILSTILGDSDAQEAKDKDVSDQAPPEVAVQNVVPQQGSKEGSQVKTAKAEYTPVLNKILHPEPPKSVSGLDFNKVKSYIVQAAQQRGLDPQVAVTVAEHEGLQKGTWQSNYRRGSYREPSYGPFQLLKGGPGTGFTTGLGNLFQKQTGLDPSDPANVYRGIDFALDQAKANGWSAWYGAKAAGVSKWQGIRA